MQTLFSQSKCLTNKNIKAFKRLNKSQPTIITTSKHYTYIEQIHPSQLQQTDTNNFVMADPGRKEVQYLQEREINGRMTRITCVIHNKTKRDFIQSAPHAHKRKQLQEKAELVELLASPDQSSPNADVYLKHLQMRMQKHDAIITYSRDITLREHKFFEFSRRCTTLYALRD
jgi:hypothetical protein